MAEDLTLYTNPMSRGRIARWMMEEVGQPYQIEILPGEWERRAAGLGYALCLAALGLVLMLTHGGG